MTVPTITVAPDAPAVTDTPAQFDAKAYPFVGWLGGLSDELNAWIAAILPLAAAAFSGTSSSSVAIGTGTKNFTASTGRGWIGGQVIRIADQADAANYMVGPIISYDPDTGALVVNVTDTGGSGTKTAWDIALEMGVPSTLRLLGYKETVVAPAAGSAFSPNLAQGTQFRFQTNANATITMPSPAAGQSCVITVEYGGTHTLSWAGATINWPRNTVPTATSVSGRKDIYSFNCTDGSEWDGAQLANLY